MPGERERVERGRVARTAGLLSPLCGGPARWARATALLRTPERSPWQSRLGAHSRCSPATGPRGLRDSLQVKCRELSFSGSLKSIHANYESLRE